MNRHANPWSWYMPPEPDGKKRLTLLVGGCMPAAYSLFHKLGELAAGYDEVTVFGFEPTGDNKSENRLHGCLKAWCRNTGAAFESTGVAEFDALTGYMRFMREDTDHIALALYGNGYSRSLDAVKSMENDTDATYIQINGAYAA